jgi:uncharacterized membrane protein
VVVVTALAAVVLAVGFALNGAVLLIAVVRYMRRKAYDEESARRAREVLRFADWKPRD